METVGEPYGFYPKLLKWKHFVPSVPKSLGQRVLRKIRSLEHFPAVCPPTRSTAASLKHRRCWAFPARHLGLRIVAIEEIGGPKATTNKPRSPAMPPPAAGPLLCRYGQEASGRYESFVLGSRSFSLALLRVTWRMEFHRLVEALQTVETDWHRPPGSDQ